MVPGDSESPEVRYALGPSTSLDPRAVPKSLGGKGVASWGVRDVRARMLAVLLAS